MLLRIFLLVILSALPCAGFAAPKILVYGDSLSAGYGIPRGEEWPNLLARRLARQGYNHVVANASISGETTSGGRARIEKTLALHRPELVILELGANDGLRGLPVPEMQRNLAAIIETCRLHKTKVLLVGMRIPPNYGPRYTQEFHASYAMLANKYAVGLLAFMLEGIAGKRTLIQEDGLHPTAAAQPRILENIWSALHPMLGRPAKAAPL